MEQERQVLGHIMVDIETMGNRSGAVICAIGAVEFDITTGKTGREYSANISIQSCMDAGLKIDASTVEWWMGKSDEARAGLFHDTSDLIPMLTDFVDFTRLCMDDETQIWGNSARFDLGILESAYHAIGIDIPWKYYRERDVRTLVSLNPEVKSEMTFKGMPHNAIDDCKHQIAYCSAIFKTISINNSQSTFNI